MADQRELPDDAAKRRHGFLTRWVLLRLPQDTPKPPGRNPSIDPATVHHDPWVGEYERLRWHSEGRTFWHDFENIVLALIALPGRVARVLVRFAGTLRRTPRDPHSPIR